MTITTKLSEKAQRLVTEDRVRRVRDHVYIVTGDHDEYTVIVSYPEEVSGMCQCPAKTVCSHLIAACAYELANPLPRHLSPAGRDLSDPFDIF